MKYGIIRIFGNELPPRDLPGQKLKILDFILRKEIPSANTEKWWIVNHVFDPELRKKACEILDHYNSKYIFLPFDKRTYESAKTTQEKMVAAIPINMCRNVALDLGKSRFDYTAILDGDCYFPGTTWNQITATIESQDKHFYYSLPMLRTSIELEEQGVTEGPLDEPQIIFHKSADIRFEENLPWGNFRDKLDVLIKLGHNDLAGHWHTLRREDQCKIVGKVHHLASGPAEYELYADPKIRADILWGLREVGFNLYLSRLGSIVMPDLSGKMKLPFHITNIC